jgi:hypothetical protein
MLHFSPKARHGFSKPAIDGVLPRALNAFTRCGGFLSMLMACMVTISVVLLESRAGSLYF